jgi:hypothetical protein
MNIKRTAAAVIIILIVDLVISHWLDIITSGPVHTVLGWVIQLAVLVALVLALVPPLRRRAVLHLQERFPRLKRALAFTHSAKFSDPVTASAARRIKGGWKKFCDLAQLTVTVSQTQAAPTPGNPGATRTVQRQLRPGLVRIDPTTSGLGFTVNVVPGHQSAADLVAREAAILAGVEVHTRTRIVGGSVVAVSPSQVRVSVDFIDPLASAQTIDLDLGDTAPDTITAADWAAAGDDK